MRPVRIRALAALLWVLAAAPGWAGVRAEVDPKEIYQGDAFLLRVLVDGDAPAAIDTSPLTDFSVTPRGRITGLRATSANSGPISVYRFELSPRRVGELVVPGLAVTVGHDRFTTAPALVRVRARPAPPRELAGQAVYLDAVASNTAPYRGEPFLYTVRLYRSVSVDAASVTPPDFPGFTAASLPGQRDYEITAAGRRYLVSEVDAVLTPQASGHFLLAPATAACQGASGGTGGQALSCASPGLAITVRPLPPFPGPGAFSGLVGRLTLTARLEEPSVPAGQGATLSVTVSGQGNLAHAPAPVLDRLPGLAVQALPPEEDALGPPAGLSDSRTFRYVLTAARPGTYALPEIAVTVFDPTDGDYKTLRAGSMQLRVTPAPAEDPALAPPLRLRTGQEDETVDASLPPWPVALLAALAPAAFFVLSRPWGRRPDASILPHGASPQAVAEALRQAVARPSHASQSHDREACRLALDRLDRLLYAGEPASPTDLAEAMDAGRAALHRRES